MSLQDPVADMLTCIKNAQVAKKPNVIMSSSKLKVAIAKTLMAEGYIAGCIEEPSENNKKNLIIKLKYHRGNPVIDTIKRVSKPSLRIYKKWKNLPAYMGGLGIVLLSTDKGVMSDKRAKQLGLGGEIICYVS